MRCVVGLLASVAAVAGQQGQPPASYGPYEWVEPDRTPVEGAMYQVFHSNTIHGDVNYFVWRPPDYEQQKTARYPVLYELPASNQTSRGGAEVVRRIGQAIRAGKLSPMIVILVNGLRGNTMYCDSRDGKYPLETVIVKDLIPHVDATYRTIASRERRALDGFSMGGFGAAHLGFKYPEVFGVISIMAPPLLGPELKQPLPSHAWSRLFALAMNWDLEYFRANDPFTLAERNADKLRDRTVIRIVAHWENENWLWPQCEKLHQVLLRNMVPHEFYFLMNVKGHNRSQCLSTMGDGAFAFFSSSLVQAPRAAAGESWEKLPDGSEGRATEFRGAGGVPIQAYVRKPAGPGPFPVIVWMHGGRDSKQATIGLGRSQQTPVEDLVRAGWAVYAADYRHAEKVGIYPVEFDDTVEAVRVARQLPFVDPKRVGYVGHSHGAQVGTRVVSRTELSGAVLCAPAAMDLIEVKKAIKRGQKLVPILSKLIADMEQKYGAPAEEIEKNPAKYGYSSGLTEAAQVRCPLLIINGRNDDNSPISMIEAYTSRLRAAGKQVDPYLPDNGPHGFYFGRPQIPETQEAARRVVAFFQERFGQAAKSPLGKVTELAEACPAGDGPVARTTCRQVEVSCNGLKEIRAQVRITEPAEGVPFRGTVVLGSGGNGAGFYGGGGGQILLREIAAMGFRVVDRAWAGGWPTQEGGLKEEACRYAALLTWVHDRFHKQGKFVATGNSGGSAEIGYALTTYGRGDILDVAIPTSGPPVARLDYACVAQASPEWAAMCARIVPRGVLDCTSGCILGTNNGVCKQVSPQPTLQQLLEDSVVHPGAVLDYPKTKLYFLFGAQDCGEPVPIGLTYATRVTSDKTIQFVPRTPHAIASTPEGREAIRKAIEQGVEAAGQ